MFRSLLNALGLGSENRFADWPVTTDQALPLDIAARSIGPLSFGASLEEARVLGRPSRIERINRETLELFYAPLGLLLQFDDAEKFEYAAFLIAPDRCDPRHAKLRHQPVRLSTGPLLTAQSTEPELVRLFGAPREVDRDEKETVLHHVSQGVQIECELSSAGTLRRLNIFPERG